MARLLGVLLSGYYQWRQRQPSQRSQQKQALQQAIARVYARFDGSAESPFWVDTSGEKPFLLCASVFVKVKAQSHWLFTGSMRAEGGQDHDSTIFCAQGYTSATVVLL